MRTRLAQRRTRDRTAAWLAAVLIAPAALATQAQAVTVSNGLMQRLENIVDGKIKQGQAALNAVEDLIDDLNAMGPEDRQSFFDENAELLVHLSAILLNLLGYDPIEDAFPGYSDPPGPPPPPASSPTLLVSSADFSWASAIEVDSNGKILTLGTDLRRYNADGTLDAFLARFNTNGTLDTSFANGGWTVYSHPGHDWANGVAVDSSGRIIVTGTSEANGRHGYVRRYDATGSLDTQFGSSGEVTFSQGWTHDCVLDPWGRIVVTGDWGVTRRFRSDGTLDTLFPYAGIPLLGYRVLLDDAGYVTVTGQYYNYSGSEEWNMAVVRYKPNGTLDSTFGSNGVIIYDSGGTAGYNDEAGYGLAEDANGKIYVGGFTQIPGHSGLAVWRLDP